MWICTRFILNSLSYIINKNNIIGTRASMFKNRCLKSNLQILIMAPRAYIHLVKISGSYIFKNWAPPLGARIKIQVNLVHLPKLSILKSMWAARSLNGFIRIDGCSLLVKIVPGLAHNYGLDVDFLHLCLKNAGLRHQPLSKKVLILNSISLLA